MGVNLGDCVKFKATVKDDEGNPLTPDSHLISIIDSLKNTVETKDNPDDKGGGVFEIEFSLPNSGPEGVWSAKWQICDVGGCDETKRFTFWVSE